LAPAVPRSKGRSGLSPSAAASLGRRHICAATAVQQKGGVAAIWGREGESHMQKITPFLWFDGKAEEAATFYVSIFKNARIVSGGSMSTTFEIDGREFTAFNGGPMFKFTEAISLFVRCDTQQEIDHLWEKLSEGGQKQRCGWLKDKYGVSWQIIPPVLGQLLQDKDPAKAKRAMQAMLQMDKIDIAALKQAAG
jgi:predicted 3-demethylubiquinone-9 3-methyltransferase (glyoxalase superfamily)